jgi:hypothetical protein
MFQLESRRIRARWCNAWKEMGGKRIGGDQTRAQVLMAAGGRSPQALFQFHHLASNIVRRLLFFFAALQDRGTDISGL